MPSPYTRQTDQAVPVIPVDEKGLKSWLNGQPDRIRNWVENNQFSGRTGTSLLIADKQGGLHAVLTGASADKALFSLAHLPSILRKGAYKLVCDWPDDACKRARLGWGLGCYRFDRYKTVSRPEAQLVVPEEEFEEVDLYYQAICRVRDLVNTPASDLGPAELSEVAKEISDAGGARFEVIEGEALEKEYPAIHAVGRASSREPRLITMRWGDQDDPPLALVGKGVIFDTGGLDIKPGDGMALMKKDMGGAAHVLALAEMIMRRKLPVNLRVYIPAVENAISGNAYRPSDIITTRMGSTVEIGNTDAEGRVVLADALTLACEDGAELIIDFATLTGAARVALGPDLPPVYARDVDTGRAIQDLSFEIEDPVWHMPLFDPYRKDIQPTIADISNTSASNMAGSMTAALFLEHFVPSRCDWCHLDIYAWRPSDRPGQPKGGEAQGLRTIFGWLERQYR